MATRHSARCFCQGMPRGFGALHKPLMLDRSAAGQSRIPQWTSSRLQTVTLSGVGLILVRYRTDNLGVAW